MSILRCKMCGGSLEIPEGVSSCTCEYCGTKQTIPTVKDENIQGLFNRANVLRMKSEFDKASDIYEKIVQNSPEEAEAYWGLILCKYGIEYVEDPKTFKRIPTCHRVSYEPVSADEDYKNALLYADAIQRGIYESQAKEIDEVQRGILQLVQKEDPYDIFICYKETDENGKRTQDSVIANDIYYQLTHEGFKVFFSAITLEDKLGSEYEPYIFSALNTAKVMLALGTRPEYFNAVWVKNEWSRFLKIMKKDRSRLLIPCYRDMDPYELPEEFAHLQAQDMGKIGFINDLVRGIKKVIAPEVAQIPVIEKISPVMGYTSNVNALLKRAQMALEDKEWKKADDFYEEVLNQNAECAEAFIGKLLIQKHFSSEDELFDAYERQYQEAEYQKQEACPAAEDHIKSMVNQYEIEGYLEAAEITHQYDFDRSYKSKYLSRKAQKEKQLSELSSERLLIRALQYATGNKKSEIEDRLANLRQILEGRMEEAKQEDAADIDRIKKAYEQHLKQADQKIIDMHQKAVSKREQDYQELVKRFSTAETDFSTLKKEFSRMHGYGESAQFEEKCQKEIDRIQEEQRQIEIQRKQKIEKDKRKRRKIIIITSGILVLCLAFSIFWVKVMIPKQRQERYETAITLIEAGDYDSGYTILKELFDNEDDIKQIIYEKAIGFLETGDYDSAYSIQKELFNSEEDLNQIEKGITLYEAGDYDLALHFLNGLYYTGSDNNQEVSNLYQEKIMVGAYITFGSYEQDNDQSNGKEPIEWQVLAKNGEQILIVSKYVLDCQPFHSTYSSTSWERSSLRKWLNESFAESAFSADEMKLIWVTDENEPEKVFILSVDDVETYFSADEQRECKPTQWAVAQGCWQHSETNNCRWWLRMPKYLLSYAYYINDDGSIISPSSYSGSYLGSNLYGVRPALWIDLGSNSSNP